MWPSLPRVPPEVCIGHNLKGEESHMGALLKSVEDLLDCVFVCAYISSVCLCVQIYAYIFSSSWQLHPLKPRCLSLGSELEEACFFTFLAVSFLSSFPLSLLHSSLFPSFLLPRYVTSLFFIASHFLPSCLYSPFPELSLWEVFQEFAFVLQL